jgi:NAD(P)-dependent dehydrogenase (short-subunit alcohol dehydrogenase family)
MTDYSKHDSFVNEVEKIVGENGINLLVQNAGVNFHDEEEGFKPESMMKAYNVNAVAPVLLARKLVPVLKKSVNSKERTIAAFIGSFLGSIELNVDPKMCAYRMSKTALNQGVRCLKLANQNESIEFVVIHPGKLKKLIIIYLIINVFLIY